LVPCATRGGPLEASKRGVLTGGESLVERREKDKGRVSGTRVRCPKKVGSE